MTRSATRQESPFGVQSYSRIQWHPPKQEFCVCRPKTLLVSTEIQVDFGALTIAAGVRP